MPLLSNRRIVAAKIETTHGTAISLGNSDAFYCSDAKYTPDIMITERPDDATLGKRTAVPGARKAKVTFRVELKGSGTSGTSPHWALILLPACGLAETTGTWTPTSSTAAYKTLTIGVYEDGVVKKICGAMCSFTLEGESGKPVALNFEFEGIYVAPADAALPTPESDTVKPPAFIGASFTLASATQAPISKVTIAQGNKVMVREDITAASGYAFAVITERDYTGKIDPEATLVATHDTWGDWLAGTEQAVSFVVGSASGNTVTITAPKAQHKTIAEGDRNSLVTDEIDFVLNKSSGDDEISIAF